MLAHPAPISVTEVTVREAASTPFHISVTALSPDPSLPLSKLTGQPATLHAVAGYAFSTGLGARTWSGVVRSAEQVHAVAIGAGEKSASTYRFEIVPRLWLLTQRRGYRIFQHLSIPDIVDEVLAEWHIAPVWRVERARYPKLEYKVQYGESDHQFVSRILEEAGIAYVLEGSEAHGSALVLADRLQGNPPRSGGALPFVDNPNAAAELEFVTRVQLGREIKPGRRALRDHDFRHPAATLFEQATPEKGVEGRLEQYAYLPGGFLVETGKPENTPVADDKGLARTDAAYGTRRAERELSAMRARARTVSFESNAMDLCPGVVLSIDGHPHPALSPAERLLVTASVLTAKVQGDWELRAEAVFANVPHRPALRTPRPVAHGFQSAKVVGPPGQEIHTDEFGRVRVQFPWDRKGKNDDRSSSWVRVHEGWGGLGYGAVALPRVGQEVLVTFLGGNPDLPVVVGRAYNAIEQVPHKLPVHKTRSTWKSDSSPGGGGFNEVMFEDQKGHELVWEQAQRDRVRLVKNDEQATVGHDRRVLVKNDLVERTEGYRKRWVGKDLDHVVKRTARERIEGDSHLTVSGSADLRIDGDQSLTVLEDQEESVEGRYALRAGKKMHLVAGHDLVGEAEDVTVKGPGGFLRIDSTGVTIAGTVVKINEGGAPGQGHGAHPEDPHDAPSYEAHALSEKKPPAEKKAAKGAVADCEVQSVVVECQHAGKRKAKITLPADKGAKAPVNVLEVIAAHAGDGDKIKTTITMARPRCAAHKPHALTVTGPKTTVTRDEDVSTVEIDYGDIDVHVHALELLWPWNRPPIEYTFLPSACHGVSMPALVRVYPQAEPSVSLEFALDTDDRVEEKIAKAQEAGYVEKRGRPAHTAWKLDFKGKVKYGSWSAELTAKFDDKLRKMATVNLMVKRGIDLFTEYFYTFTGVTLRPVFPKLSLAYEGKFKEIDGSWRVGAEWSIKLKAEPLLGISAKFDILDLLIRALGAIPALAAISKGLLKIKSWAKEKGQTFEITLTLSGTVGGDLGAKKEAKLAKAGVDGSVEGKIKVEFAAKASFGSKGIIGFEVGAEVKGDTGVAAGLSLGNNDNGVYLKGRFALLGCKFKFSAWASGKVFWEIKESYDGEYTFWEEHDFLEGKRWYLMGSPEAKPETPRGGGW
jgi:type VI secretion system secreted protein VgrG